MERVYAIDRDESECCERGTPGCSIAHTAETLKYFPDEDPSWGCETW